MSSQEGMVGGGLMWFLFGCCIGFWVCFMIPRFSVSERHTTIDRSAAANQRPDLPADFELRLTPEEIEVVEELEAP